MRLTPRVNKIDARLLAIARGELEPDDPFAGRIPIYEYDEPAVLEVDDRWLMIEPEPEPASDEALIGRSVPSLRLHAHELLALPMDPSLNFFISQIDGKRSVEEVVALCGLDDLCGLEIIDELLRLGAIELR